MKPELLPCPFCGGIPTAAAFPGNRNTWCSNQPRDCHNTAMYSREQWNTRAKSAPTEVAQGEAVEVVGFSWLDTAHFRRKVPALCIPEHWHALMTVAQHNRIMAALTAPPSPDAELVALLRGLVEIVGRKNRGRPGSPNHGHTIPGIWDSDNGDLAGKPCAECALYDLAVARIAALQP